MRNEWSERGVGSKRGMAGGVLARQVNEMNDEEKKTKLRKKIIQQLLSLHLHKDLLG